MQLPACLACQGPLAATPAVVSRDRQHGYPGSFAIHRCLACGSGTTLPLVRDDELAVYYPSGYVPHELPTGAVFRAMQSMQRLRNRRFPLAELASNGPAGTLLDVGCGRGDLAASWIERGYRVVGVEPSAAAAAVASRRGAEVLEGTLSTVELPERAFDAVVFRHSLEHVVDPQLNLRRAFAALRPGGRLVVIVPNWDSWQRRAFGEYWYPLDLPRHRVHLSAKGLRRTIESSGFRDLVIRPATPLITTTWSLQLRFFDRLLTTQGAALLAGYTASIPVGLVACALDQVLGGGDFLHAAARRPSV